MPQEKKIQSYLECLLNEYNVHLLNSYTYYLKTKRYLNKFITFLQFLMVYFVNALIQYIYLHECLLFFITTISITTIKIILHTGLSL